MLQERLHALSQQRPHLQLCPSNAHFLQVGRVVGNFYNEHGDAVHEFPWARLRANQEANEALKRRFPGCNSKWTQADGSTVWCTTKSGGIDRAWAGVPRLMKLEGAQRCVCVPPIRADSSELEQYEGCPPESERCKVHAAATARREMAD